MRIITCVALTGLLTACGNTDISCTAPETQKMVKQLYAIQIERQAKTGADQLADQLLDNAMRKNQSEETQMVMNSLKALATDIGSISLSETENLSTNPSDNTQNKFSCKALVTSQWSNQAEKIKASLAQYTVLGSIADGKETPIKFENGSLTHAIEYESYSEKERHVVQLKEIPSAALLLFRYVVPEVQK
jgi:type II secretory pathway component PulK